MAAEKDMVPVRQKPAPMTCIVRVGSVGIEGLPPILMETEGWLDLGDGEVDLDRKIPSANTYISPTDLEIQVASAYLFSSLPIGLMMTENYHETDQYRDS